MPLGSGGGGFDYFVWNNSNGGPSSTSWNYGGDYGNGRLDLTISNGGAVPEPASWALMLVGFGGLGAALRGSRRRAAAAATA
ncbi:MAG: PEP-CTERM sorting domain-containing protein [Phenylobacterium sp.]|nr:MAG: PEP-CTERM sorting domain-containing protein [Phenylobacterium sp.]